MLLRAVLICLVLSGCVGRGTPIPGDVIDKDFVTGGFRWDSGTTVYVMVKTFDADGKVGVCGAWSARGGANLVASFHEEILGGGSVNLGESRIVQGLTFMQEHGPEGRLNGKSANCVQSSVDWEARFASERPLLSFPRMRVNI